jgi:hypothetical protein
MEDPTALLAFRWYKYPLRLQHPQNPSHFLFFSLVPQLLSAAHRRRRTTCGLRPARRGAPPGPRPSASFPFFPLLLLPRFPSPKTREHQGEFTAEAAWRRRQWRRHWPPRRRARSPAGERAAVERLSGGARFARRWGPMPLQRLCPRACAPKAAPAAVGTVR